MKNTKLDKRNQRVIAVFMVWILLFSWMPISQFHVLAATEQHPGCVTVTAEDESGNPISGADVTYLITSMDGLAQDISGTAVTNHNGTVEVLTETQFQTEGGNLRILSAKISKEGYQTDTATVQERQITTGADHFKVTMKSVTVPGITVEGITELYREEGYPAVTVNGTIAGDVVLYQMNGAEGPSEQEPIVRDVGTYSVRVIVKRNGYQDFETTVESTIKENTIPDDSITARQYQGNYDKRAHDAIYDIVGLQENDETSYSLDNEPAQDTMPQITNARKYSLTLSVKRKGYHEFKKTFDQIEIFPIEIDGLSAVAYTGVYDRKEHDAVTVQGANPDNDIVEYRKAGTENWNAEPPKIINAGRYAYEVRVTRKDNANYKQTMVELEPAEAYIAKADQTLAFDHYTEESSEITLQGLPPYSEILDFTATDTENLAGGTVTYRVGLSEENAGIAEISETDGMLKVKGTGTIPVIAELSGNDNYNVCTITHELKVKAEPKTPGQYIVLDHSDVRYALGENSGIVSDRKAKGVVGGTFSYTIDNPDLGLSCDVLSGKVSVEDYKKLGAVLMEHEGSITLNVTAKREADQKYEEDSASYPIVISFADTPADPYKIDGRMGNNDWYTSGITVSAADVSYSISKTYIPDDFTSSVSFDEEGTLERYVYLRNNITGGITDKILLEGVKIDTVRPDSNQMEITYSEAVLDSGMFGFYQSNVLITFTAYDENSGVDTFTWEYTRAEGASTTNLAWAGGASESLPAIQDAQDPTKYTAELILPQKAADQLRGNLSVIATDQAGLDSYTKTDDGKIIVVDTISPALDVTYQLEELGGKTQEIGDRVYFSDRVVCTFHMDEANFFAEDFIIKVAKDGGRAEEAPAVWTETANQDQYEAKVILPDEGDYLVFMEWKQPGDRSGNEMKWKPTDSVIRSYQSQSITIDKTAPVIAFSYTDYAAKENAQTAKIMITEHNFRQEDIEVETSAEDITGKQISLDLQGYLRNCVWTSTGDRHTATISSQFVDAIYQLKLNYKDLALNEAQEVTTDSFIVDHAAPEASSMSVTYSVPLVESILSAITFGFYHPSVTITFCANDMTSGVDYFIWSYQRENGASDSNVESYTDVKVNAIQDSADRSKFTASVTLPETKAEQLRGNIAFTATDSYQNKSRKLTDSGHIIVVDTITPAIEAEYSKENRAENKKMYYNQAATLTLTITEANFYPEDIVVEVAKDGGSYKKTKLAWNDQTTDVHRASYTIKAPKNHAKDGDYVVRVSYMDRSGNKMKTYISRTMVIDTKKPVIDVSYENQNAVDTLTDTAGHTRKYFHATQTATITINEHNFQANEVNFTITAEDASGGALDAQTVSRKSSWSTDGDLHTMTITYPGDANYTFDVAYTDLATNEAADYQEDYFTVDKTAPVNLQIAYSTSILDTVLEHITFGFYQAPVTVTIDAEDATSGVYGFQYGYIKEEGVSSVNAELLDQAIEEAEITYTNHRNKATAMFEIPKRGVTDRNQFHGLIWFTATDRSGNESDVFQDTKRIVVDNISPTATVEYNAPIQTVNGISYYDDTITAAITMNEANFYTEDVEVTATKDGAAYPVTASWSGNDTDVHTGTFTLTEDGDYFITIHYTDKSSNEMVTYTSDQLTVDTDIAEPKITINGGEANGMAFQDDVNLEISFEDINFEDYQIMLTRTSYEQNHEDVTDDFITGHMNLRETGGRGVFRGFEKTAENDGIYRLEVTFTDKAGHESKVETMFTINRFGSVYEYSDYLQSLILEGGAYKQEITDDLVITEYNADKLVSDSLNIEISCDGRPLSDASFQVTPEINDQAITGSRGWYQYQYTIDKENFSADGVYKISVSSRDQAGNMPENINYQDKSILFRVDSTAPEIDSVTGLESSIINAMDVTVNYTVYDTMGLRSVEVYVSDGKSNEKVSEITDFTEDRNHYAGSFTLAENSAPQTVQLIVKDLADNITDTNTEDFSSAFDFHNSVTVSTNFFVRFYANKPLFWGLNGTLSVTVAFVIGCMVRKRKKRAGAGDEPKE